MIVYYSTPCSFTSVFKELQKQRISNEVNFLSCPAVQDAWKNTYVFREGKSSIINYSLDSIFRSEGLEVTKERKPHLKETNTFNLLLPSFFFAEESLRVKLTSPYFHKTSWLEKAAVVSGVFDIGKWFRPIQIELVTWSEEGTLRFEKEDPVFYLEFLTEEKLEFKQFRLSPLIEYLSLGLVNSSFREKPQGSLESRYQAFENSDYRRRLLEEIKAAVVDKVD